MRRPRTLSFRYIVRRVLWQGFRYTEIKLQYTLVSSVFIVCPLGRLLSVCYALAPPYLVDRSLVLLLPFRSSFSHCQLGGIFVSSSY